MKTMIKRFALISTVVGLCLTVPVSATAPEGLETEANAPSSSSMPFQIPYNNFCSNSESGDFDFEIVNTSDQPVTFTLYFYNVNGASITAPGLPGSADSAQTNIVPGTKKTLAAHAAALYYADSTSSTGYCTTGRPFSGEIVVNSGEAVFMARGSLYSARRNTNFSANILQEITVNNGQPFKLIATEPTLASK
ncbi:hypothetical protein [Paenibacillus sp. y28]|uniref:hypothetical protein n=1 Tax=Paenibacillus sp. y28 TaxID=3129110 RepID=UPI003018CD0B